MVVVRDDSGEWMSCRGGVVKRTGHKLDTTNNNMALI